MRLPRKLTAHFLIAALVLPLIMMTRRTDAWSLSSSKVAPPSFSERSLLASFAFAPTRQRGGSQQTTTTQLSMNNPLLDDWKVLRNGRVVGTIKNHPTIPDGDVITTSPIARPDLADKRKVVVTRSGSKYLLGEPAYVEARNGVVSIQELQRQARVEKDLTGDVIGDEDENNERQYLLSGRPYKSTSGKSRLWKAYRADDNGLPVGEPVLVKISNNWEALDREHANYGRITKSGINRGQFVKLLDYLPTASSVTTGPNKFKGQSALVLERGIIDLKRFLSENGKMDGRELRDAASAAAQCLQAVHASGLVWTDMKTENFIVGVDGKIKGIDLESAMPVRDNPVDYSPEATPPEFAAAFLSGDGPYFTLEYNYDLWSFGMMLYELATGRGYFDGRKPLVITKLLKEGAVIGDKQLEKVEDLKMRDLIRQCLQINPKARPNILQVLLHPYFLSTGFGPLSF